MLLFLKISYLDRICPENGAPIQQDCFASVKEFVLNQIQNQ